MTIQVQVHSGSALKLTDVFAKRGDRIIFSSVNAEFKAGGLYILTGKNGSGKSTILEVAAQLYDDECGGLITLDGVDVRQIPPLDVVRNIGLVYQQSTSFSMMSIYENVIAGLRLRQLNLPGKQPDYRQLVEKLLMDVGLWDVLRDRLHQPGTGLSGGQIKRLCLARTLATNPSIVLFDEPFAGVDADNVVIIENLIERMTDRTVIVVTHDSAQAKRILATSRTGEYIRRDSGHWRMKDGTLLVKEPADKDS